MIKKNKSLFGFFGKKKQKKSDIEQKEKKINLDSIDLDDLEDEYEGWDDLRTNQKQIIDFSKNKNDDQKMLNAISLDEMSILERELSFNYDILDYKILETKRENNRLVIKCELTTLNNTKEIVVQEITKK